MKPKSIRAALQLMLPEIEEMMSLGVSRAEIIKQFLNASAWKV